MSKSEVNRVLRRKSARASVDVSRSRSANCLISEYELIPTYGICQLCELRDRQLHFRCLWGFTGVTLPISADGEGNLLRSSWWSGSI